MTNHEHNYTKVVRERGSKVRKQCECLRIGPWEKPRIITHVDLSHAELSLDVEPNLFGFTVESVDLTELSKAALADMCKGRGLPHSGTKAQLIERLNR